MASRASEGGASRGGRGGRRGGKSKIGGVETSWHDDKEVRDKLDALKAPMPRFPDVPQLRQRPASSAERRAVGLMLDYRKRARRGPLFMVVGNEARVMKKGETKASRFNPFEGNATYSHRYKPPTRQLPKFAPGQHSFKYFPRELWSTIDRARAPKRKSREDIAARLQQQAEVDEAENDDDEADDTGDVDEDNAEGKKSGDEDDPDENPDDDFSEADSDMAGDYNAEHYFDNGENDDEDGGGDDDHGGDGD